MAYDLGRGKKVVICCVWWFRALPNRFLTRDTMLDDEKLVGGLAILLGIMFLCFSLGPWESPYRLRSTAIVTKRFGKPAARLFWLLLAVILGGLGVAIVTDLRPSYAKPVSVRGLSVGVDAARAHQLFGFDSLTARSIKSIAD